MEILNFIIPFIILLTVVVFIHEYGHYYFARRYGVGVTDFSIGFGKELFGFNDKSGTRWKFCLIPLGGYVKFYGDRNVFSQAEQEELLKKYSREDQNKLFVTKPLYQRSLIVAAGPLANFVLAIFIFSFIYMIAGKDFTPAQIQEVQNNSPAFITVLSANKPCRGKRPTQQHGISRSVELLWVSSRNTGWCLGAQNARGDRDAKCLFGTR